MTSCEMYSAGKRRSSSLSGVNLLVVVSVFMLSAGCLLCLVFSAVFRLKSTMLEDERWEWDVQAGNEGVVAEGGCVERI